MTKEELKQEAEEWLCNNLHSASEEDFIKAVVDIAEPREKRIAELEQENKVLAQNLEDTEIVNKALEKENAKLKKLKRDCETSLCRAEYQWMYERFEKSKEIIKKLINTCCSYGATGRATAEAEQFISEVE